MRLLFSYCEPITPTVIEMYIDFKYHLAEFENRVAKNIDVLKALKRA
jgi:hypothetical protein